jgi:hypothetical protein
MKLRLQVWVDILQIVWPQNQVSIRISAQKFLFFAVSTPALKLFPQELRRTKLEADQPL